MRPWGSRSRPFSHARPGGARPARRPYNSDVSESFGRPLDTPAAVFAAQAARWREMSASEKVALVSAMSRATRELAAAGIAARYPHAGERERFLRLAMLLLGPDLARRVYHDARQLVP